MVIQRENKEIGENNMSENKALKKENGQKPKVETTEEEVESYAYCASFKQKCMNYCLPDYATPF